MILEGTAKLDTLAKALDAGVGCVVPGAGLGEEPATPRVGDGARGQLSAAAFHCSQMTTPLFRARPIAVAVGGSDRRNAEERQDADEKELEGVHGGVNF